MAFDHVMVPVHHDMLAILVWLENVVNMLCGGMCPVQLVTIIYMNSLLSYSSMTFFELNSGYTMISSTL